jgi:hypothetical protein
MKILNQLKTITEEEIRLIIESVPKEWEIDNQVRNRWVDFLLQRAVYISKNFLPMWKDRHQLSLSLEEN